MNKSVKSIIVLPLICLIVVAVLAAVNHVTAPIIEKNARMEEQKSLREVLPGSEVFEELELPEAAPATVTGVYREENGKGFAVTVSTTSSYSQNPMTFTVGISAEKKIVGITITNYSETKDFGSYPDTFIGKDSSLEGVDITAGVTYSSEAFKGAVRDVFAVIEEVAE